MTTMATTVQQALHPLLVFSSLIGLGIYTREKPRPLQNILCTLTAWSTYTCLFCYSVITLEVGYWFLTVSSIINTGVNIIITVTSVVMVVRCDEKFRIFMKRLAAVDDTLEELGTPKTYRKLQTRVKGMIVIWVAHYLIINITDMVWCFFATNDRRTLILPYIINHYRHVNTFVDLSFILLVWYIGTKFDKVNEQVRCLVVKEKHGLRRIWTNAAPSTHRYIMCTDNYKRVFWTSMHLHLELNQIAHELNAMYGIQMTLEMIAYLILILAICYFFYVNIMTMENYISIIRVLIDADLWVLTCVTKIYCLNYICETVSDKANEVKGSIHQLTDPIQYADIRDEIYQFTLQLMQHPLKFTGVGFFRFGYGFMRKFSLTIVAFAIIVVQMASTKLKPVVGF